MANLLVHEDPADERTGWAGEAPVPVSVHGEVLAAIGVEPVFAARLVDVALRAAAGTGASVRIVPRAERGPDDDLGALLRWT